MFIEVDINLKKTIKVKLPFYYKDENYAYKIMPFYTMLVGLKKTELTLINARQVIEYSANEIEANKHYLLHQPALRLLFEKRAKHCFDKALY